MINVGIVGIGFMGMVHYLAYQKASGVKVRAVVSRDEKKLAGDWRGIQGNFGPPGQQMDLSGVRGYRELGELLDDSGIDLVDICLPPALHADAAIAAMKAGKHVFCEKPIAVSASDARRMVDASRRHGRLLLIGHVLPFVPEYAFARRVIERGKHGKLLGGFFKRIISDPKWLPDFFDPTKVGGPLVDLHIHDAHFIRMLCGMPSAVFSRGRMRGEVAEYVTTQFLFDDRDMCVSACSGIINQQGRAFTHAFEIHLERATLIFDFAVINGAGHVATQLTVLDHKGGAERPELGAGDPIDGFVAEIKEVARSVRTGNDSTILSSDLARDALLLCHKQTQSLRTGKLARV